MDKFIVIFDGGGGIPVFLSEENGDACVFDTRKDAVLMAEGNNRARHVGYQVKPWSYAE